MAKQVVEAVTIEQVVEQAAVAKAAKDAHIVSLTETTARHDSYKESALATGSLRSERVTQQETLVDMISRLEQVTDPTP